MQGLSCNSGLLCMYSVEEAINVLAEVGYQAIDISLEVAQPPLLADSRAAHESSGRLKGQKAGP